MTFIKVYSKGYAALTSFLDGEYSNLQYRTTKGEVGDASFTLDISNAKVTATNLLHYNRVEVVEGQSDGSSLVRWSGYIVLKQVTRTVVQIRCKSLIGLLKKRLVSAGYTLSGNAGTAIGTLLTAINAADPTGITLGTVTLANNINQTFDNQDALYILNNIADTSVAQFEVNASRAVNVKTTIGTDRSASVILRFNVNQIDQSNILSFSVEDNGDGIVSKAYGLSNGLTSTQQSTPLTNTYGVLEAFQNYRVANVQPDVDSLTTAQLIDSRYSPTIDLSPSVTDNFEVGDLVRVQILNKLINIDSSYQVLDKKTTVLGNEKRISVKINSLPQNFINEVADVKLRLALLETQV